MNWNKEQEAALLDIIDEPDKGLWRERQSHEYIHLCTIQCESVHHEKYMMKGPQMQTRLISVLIDDELPHLHA